MSSSLRRILAFTGVVGGGVLLGAVWLVDRALSFPTDDQPCVPAADALRPMETGATAPAPALGRMLGSDCRAAGRSPVAGARWRSLDPAVATVTADGVVRAVAPGAFRLEVRAEGHALPLDGFVLPPGWRVDAGPDSVVVAVGDTVRLPVRAVDAAGAPLPAVPWWVDTPAYRAWAAELDAWAPGDPSPPLPGERASPFDRPFDQSRDTATVARFVALQPGEATLVARIGARADSVHVTVRGPGRDRALR